MGVGVIGIEIDGALKEFTCRVVVVTRLMREGLATAQDVLVRCEVAGRLRQNALLLEAGEPERAGEFYFAVSRR